MHIIIEKAQPIGDQPVENLTIEARHSFPEFSDLHDAMRKHQKNARWIGEALVKTLPGGTIDQLLIFLLEHRTSLLRVPYAEPHADFPAAAKREF